MGRSTNRDFRQKKAGSWGTSGLIYSGYNIYFGRKPMFFFGGNLWFLSFRVVSFLGVLVAFSYSKPAGPQSGTSLSY